MNQSFSMLGAKNGTRTRDPQLGKLMLYQLSYFRMHGWFGKSTNSLKKTAYAIEKMIWKA